MCRLPPQVPRQLNRDFHQVLNELRAIRRLANLVRIKGLLAEGKGEFTKAARSWVDLLRLSAKAARGGDLIHRILWEDQASFDGLRRVAAGLDAETGGMVAGNIIFTAARAGACSRPRRSSCRS